MFSSESEDVYEIEGAPECGQRPRTGCLEISSELSRRSSDLCTDFVV